MSGSGFREIEHTADWELETWASDLAGLLAQSARGMYALSGIGLATRGRRAIRRFSLVAPDPESLLVRFLSELLILAEAQRLAFDQFDLQVQAHPAETALALNACLRGRRITAQDKEVKAVTYHNLQVRKGPDGLAVNIVFDV